MDTDTPQFFRIEIEGSKEPPRMITNHFFVTRCSAAWSEKGHLLVEDVASAMTKKLLNN
jgi:hypothetical protein